MSGHPIPAQPVLVELSRVGKSYRRGDEVEEALVGVSLDVRAAEMVAITGPSGCGKSTTLNLIAGVDRPDEGRIRVADIDVATADEVDLVRLRRTLVGVVFQAFHLMPHLSVEENVALPLALAGRSDPARVREVVDRVGLGRRRDYFPGELSGGEQQRTAVARALVHRPRVVLADEPTGNLDSRSGTEVLQLLDEMRREEGTSLILVTHDESIATLADQVVRMRDGRIEAVL